MKNQVTSIEQSKRLIEQGVPEQEAEERMREKAVEAFKSSCRYRDGCAAVIMPCDSTQCEDLRLFIQKLNEE